MDHSEIGPEEEEPEEECEGARFELFRVPPELERAQVHEKCNRYGRPNRHISEGAMCGCCGYVENQPYPLAVPTDQLHASGPVVPLMFRLYKTLMLLSFLLLLLGLPGQYRIVEANCREGIKDSFCGPNLKTLLDVTRRRASREYSQDYFKYSTVPIPLVFILIIIGHHVWSFKFKNLVLQNRVSPADFTLTVAGLEEEQLAPERLQELFDSMLRAKNNAAPPCTIAKMTVAKYEGRDVERQTKIEMARHKLEMLETLRQKTSEPAVLHELEKRAEKHAKYIQKKQAKPQPHASNPVAFVSFRHREDAERILQAVSFCSKLKHFLSYLLPCLKTPCISRAPEPSDVCWSNIGYSKQVILLRTFASLFLVSAAILGGGFLQYFFHLKKIELSRQKERSSEKEKWQLYYKLSALQLFICVLVFAMNKSLHWFINYLSRFEKHLSTSDTIVSCVFKVSTAQLFNTILPVLYLDKLHLEEPAFFMAQQMYYMQLTNMVLTPVTKILFWKYLWTQYKRWAVTRKLARGQVYDMTQVELNKLFTPDDIKLNAVYAEMFRTVTVAVFFYELLPIGMLICLVSLFIQFHVNKYLLLRRYGKTVCHSYRLAFRMNMIFQKLPVKFCLGMLFYFRYGEINFTSLESLLYNLKWFATLILVNVLPLKTIAKIAGRVVDRSVLVFRHYFSKKPSVNLEQKLSTPGEEQSEQTDESPDTSDIKPTYEAVSSSNIDTDYERRNPLTKFEACERFKRDKQARRSQKTLDQSESSFSVK